MAFKLRNLQTSRVAAFSLLLALITSITTGASWAQGSVVPNRITSIQEGRDKTYIELTTEKSSVPTRPIIKILPQDNGDTVMVADFVGLSWQHPTRVFSTSTGFGAHQKGIKVIRAGSFQERPPICRISITSNDKNLLSRVSFGANPGKLTVTWPLPVAANTVPRVALPRFEAPQRNVEQQSTQRAESIRRIDFDGSRARGADQRGYDSTAPDAKPTSKDADLAAQAAIFAARKDLELAAPGNAAPLAINTSSDEQPPVAPTRGLTLRPEIPNEGYVDTGSLLAAPVAPKLRARSQEIPLKAVAKPLEPTIQTASKPISPGLSPGKPLAPVKQAAANLPDGWPRNAENTKIVKGKPPTKQPVKLASANNAPPLAPKRTASREVDAKEAVNDTADGEVSDGGKEPKRKGLLSSLFKKVKETLSCDQSNDIEGQDSEHGTANSQLDEAQTQNIPIANSDLPAAPTRTAASTEKTAPNGEERKADAPGAVEREQPPLVEVVQSGASTTVRVTAAGPSELNFHSFKLQDPPRFVVDFDNLRSLSSSLIEQPEKNNKLLSIRVGAPDAGSSKGRLVFDLASPEVTVIPADQGKPNVVAFTIGTSRDSLVGIVPKSGSTIVLDAGHGGTDCGAQRGSVQEKELTLSIAKATQRVLQSRGVKVIMTRDSDAFVSLQDRVNITNSVNPDLFLSVHINAMESTNNIYGVETYYQNAVSQALASSIHESLTQDLEAPDRRIRKARFVVINRTEVPAVLAEVGFISNKAERDKLVSADYQEKIANALAKGAILFLNQQAGATKHLADRSPAGTAKERKAEAGSTDKRVDTGVPSVSRVAQKGLGIQQK